MTDELIRKSASELLELLKRDEISPVDLLDALEKRIAEVDEAVNALPTLCFERARKNAALLMKKPIEDRGLLAGLPVAIKDLEPVSGVRTTWGSPIYSDFIPTASDCLVERIEDNGGIIYAKSNTPEFGAGANTFNEVFGKTRNPWNTDLSCAGSSGGSAVALATGTAWLATGSDVGGSLRNPASFCSIVGFRPSPGRVSHGAAADGAYPPEAGALLNSPINVAGPMARNVPDTALLLDAMSGVHPADPMSIPYERGTFFDAVQEKRLPRRIAFSPDFGGITPVDSEVASITEKAARTFEAMGCEVELDSPDFSDVQDIFLTNRAMIFYVGHKQLLENHREALKPEVIWNIEQAGKITLDDIDRVERARAAYLKRTLKFMENYDLLLSPATIVPPFPVEERFVASCNGIEFDNYIQWCTIAYAITILGFPAISVPAGFTQKGLPVGLQIVAGPRAEADLLSAAAAYEASSGLATHIPIDPRKGTS